MAKLQSGTRIYGNANVDSNIFVGANVVVNTSMVFVGNSTVNADMTSTLVQVTNSTSTANLTAADLKIGATTVVNSSQLTAAALYATTSANVASAMLANATGLYPSTNSIALGNTTARWVINANTINGSGDWTTTGNVSANNANTTFDLTVGRNLTVTGNLTILGSSTVLQGNAITFSDNMLYLNQGILATITGVSGNGTYIDFTANNNFQVGWDVFVSGVTPSSYNGNYQNIFSANSTHFTVANTNTDTYVSGGTARGKTDQNPDLGIAAGYNDGTYHHTGLFRDASDGFWKVFDNYAPEPDAAVNIDTSNLTFHTANFWANTIQVGNTTVYSTINTTSFDGTSNNTNFVGAVSAANVVSNAQLSANLANYQTTAGLSANVATLTANNTSFVGTVSAANVVSNAQLSANLSNYVTTTALTNNLANYQTTAGLSANVATLTANNTSFVGTVSAANVVSNAQLSANLSNYQTTAGLSANVATLTANNTSFVGTVSAANVVSNAQLSANLSNYQTTAGLSANVATLTANNSTYLNGQLASYYTNATNITTGTLPYAQIPANILNTTASFTISGVYTYNANVILGSGLSANGGFGTAGQVLTSNGTATYWSTVSGGGSVNLDSTYAWNNNHTWSAAANLVVGVGAPTDTRFYVNTYWTTDVSTYNFYVDSRDNNTALTAIRNRYGIYSSLNNRSQNKNVDGVTTYNSNYRAVVGDVVSGSSTSGGNAFASELIGGNFRSYNYANGSGANGVNAAFGTRNQAFSYGTGTIISAYGSQNQVLIGNSTATGNITTAYGVYSEVQSNTSATIATGYNFYGAHTGSTTTNKFGVYVTGEANNYFSGNVTIAGTINTAALTSTGNVGFGAAVPTFARLYTYSSLTTDTSTYNYYSYTQDNNTAMTVARTKRGHTSEIYNFNQNKASGGGTTYETTYYAVQGEAFNGSDSSSQNAYAGELTGGRFGATQFANGVGANAVSVARGVYGIVTTGSPSGGTVNNAYGVMGQIYVPNTSAQGIINTAYGVWSGINGNSGVTVNNGYLFYGSVSGTVTNNFGIYLTGESNNYFSGNTHFNSNVGIGAASGRNNTILNLYSNITGDFQTQGVYTFIDYANAATVAQPARYGVLTTLRNQSQNKDSGGTPQATYYRAVVGEVWNGDSSTGGDARAQEMFGGNFRVYNYANGVNANTIAIAKGSQNQVYNQGSGVITEAQGAYNRVLIANTTVTGNITTAWATYSEIQSNTAATIGTGYLYYGQYTGSTTTTKYGLYITGEANNYLSGNLVVGGSINAAAYAVGTAFIANTSQVTIATLPLSANGGVGTAGQVLTSNGATGAPYWSTASGGSVNVNATYAWTNTHTFAANVAFNANVAIAAALSANGSQGTTGQVLTAATLGNTYWSTLSLFNNITIQTLTSGTGASYVAPSDLKYAIVIATGGGGGGGGSDANDTAAGGGGGGGGAGATVIGIFSAAQMSGATYTIGAGGSGGSGTNGTVGTTGGTTTFTPSSGTALSAGGGTFGLGSGLPAVGNSAPGGSSGSATGGDIRLSGGSGSYGVGDDIGEMAIGGHGGASYWGGGGGGAAAQGAATTAVSSGVGAYGAGGGGSATVDQIAGSNGGSGVGGVVVVIEFRG